MKLTKGQQELLNMLALGPRYGFTDKRLINALVSKGLARGLKSGDYKITAAGRRLVPPRRRFDQSTSQDTPGFVEAFRVMT